ncbi:hypothetical protein GCM10023349_22750 [Nocardioides conyzicola]|uniref:Uncharacterized protein n=2 Tax=Nocardioides conyzicola TaxID=1651781 RepID=A0ABP8XF36_9ACTN
MRLVVAALLPLVLLAGCGDDTVSASELTADPAGTPYAGPMGVLPDHSDLAVALAASGSAGLAAECAGEPRRGGGGDYADGGLESVQETPQKALDNWIDEESAPVPRDGYRIERVDGDRVLLSYDVDRLTKVAVIVRDGITDFNDDTGWGVESWSSCDPAELGVDVAEDLGFQIWTDRDGRPVPTTDVTSSTGAAHCDWQDLTWLSVGQTNDVDRDVDQYLSGDDDGQLADFLSTAADDSATLPDDAADTRWRRDGRELWIGEDPAAAYLVSLDDPTDVQLWPAVTEPIGCA